jgi:hypothetical protein
MLSWDLLRFRIVNRSPRPDGEAEVSKRSKAVTGT